MIMSRGSARPYSIGSDRWPGLSKLIEECGEVIQVAGKLLATGGERTHWDGTDLKIRMEDEIGDLQAAIIFVIRRCGLDVKRMDARVMKKLELFERWHQGRDPAKAGDPASAAFGELVFGSGQAGDTVLSIHPASAAAGVFKHDLHAAAQRAVAAMHEALTDADDGVCMRHTTRPIFEGALATLATALVVAGVKPEEGSK